MERALEIATRHSLLGRLQDWEDQESWRQFFDTYWRLIYGVAVKAGLTETEAQEVVQETVLEIAKRLKQAEYKAEAGSFKSWLLRVTRWRIGDQFRKRKPSEKPRPREDDTRRTATIDQLPDPQSLNLDQYWENEWRENMVEAARDRIRHRLPTKYFQAFDLMVTRRWPVGTVARAVGMNVGQVYLAKFRVLKLLKEEIKRLEKQVV